MKQEQTKNAESSLARITEFFESVMASQGGYLSDQLYVFMRDANKKFQFSEAVSEQPHKTAWLVLGREHYFETYKDYPIANKRDLLQALSFDDEKAPFKGKTLKHITRLDEQSHRVTFWVIPDKTWQHFAAMPWLIIPETYLLAKAIDNNMRCVSIERKSGVLFLSTAGKSICSGMQSSNLPDIESFALSTGAPLEVDSNTSNYPANDFTNLLSKGLKSINLLDLGSFVVKREKRNFNDYPWQKALAVTGVSILLYSALTSAWLAYRSYDLNHELEASRGEVNESLTTQKSLERALLWHNELSQPVREAYPYWRVWPIILEVIEVGTELTLIQHKDSRILIRGFADKELKATDVLAKLSELSPVKSASFDQPVRNYRGKDEFFISFSLVEEAN